MKNPFLVLVMIIGLVGVLAGQVTAQTFTTLYNFSSTPDFPGPYTNSDGSHPHGVLFVSGNTLYGTTWQGGTNGNGIVFAVSTDGKSFTNLHTFSALSRLTNNDGANPQGGLILSGNTLYGTASAGGKGTGTVFAVNTDGTGFTNLHSFTGGSDGAGPYGALTLGGTTLYGTTIGGGSGGGTVFAINTDGTGYTNLYGLTAGSDGAYVVAGLTLSGNTLYGTAGHGGSSGSGTVFAINTDGTGFTNLHTFAALNNSTNSDGAFPYAGLALSGSTLYGMANRGGMSGYGAVFAVNTNGTGFTNLHSFSATSPPIYANSDGAYPNEGVLALFGNTLYSTTAGGGGNGSGAVFAINTDGTGFKNIHTFSFGGDPWAGLISSGNTLYGTANIGGASSSGSGTVFSLFIQPQLTIIPAGGDAILTWPTNYSDFVLQSSTNLTSPVWTTNSISSVVVNGQNTVTNPISGTQQFYRLSQ